LASRDYLAGASAGFSTLSTLFSTLGCSAGCAPGGATFAGATCTGARGTGAGFTLTTGGAPAGTGTIDCGTFTRSRPVTGFGVAVALWALTGAGGDTITGWGIG